MATTAMRFESVDGFFAELDGQAAELCGKGLEHCRRAEIYRALVRLLAGKALRLRAVERSDAEKEIYYFSMEFLPGRLMKSCLAALGAEDIARRALARLGISLDELCELEPDPGLGSGGLGRLAACFMESSAFLGLDCTGMGLRYSRGLFRQKIIDGRQIEEPDPWLEAGYPWETAGAEEAVEVRFGGHVESRCEDGKLSFSLKDCSNVLAVPYDVPVVGRGGARANLLRLWRALPAREWPDLEAAAGGGDYSGEPRGGSEAEALTAVLYPDDSDASGRELRLKQEYFLAAAGVGHILRSYKRRFGAELRDFPKRVRMHINDTHPALCIRSSCVFCWMRRAWAGTRRGK